jgi:Tol biopolymer transport system component
VTHPENMLWRAKADGSARAQLTFAPMQVHAPRFSPDGKRIALMASRPGNPWKVYVMPADGGSPQEVKADDKNQGDPTWMPDGTTIIFAGIPWLDYGPSSGPNIHQIDLKTGTISDLPGSEGLFSPRCSPDGRFVAALSSDSTRLLLYSFEKNQWSELAQAKLGFETWSRDGKYLFAEDYSDSKDDFVRVNVQSGKVDRLYSIKQISRGFDPWEFWIGLAPDDSLLLMQDRSTEEIYSLDVKFP